MNPKIFLRAPWEPIYISFEGVARVEKKFLVKIFQTCLKMPFFNNLPARTKSGQNSGKAVIWSTLKKRRKIFRKFIENQSPPRENPRSAPDETVSVSEQSPECSDCPFNSYRISFGKRKH